MATNKRSMTPVSESITPSVNSDVTLGDGLESGSTTTENAQREELIRKAAYLISERRGFAQGHEIEDWLEAQQQVDYDLAARDEP